MKKINKYKNKKKTPCLIKIDSVEAQIPAYTFQKSFILIKNTTKHVSDTFLTKLKFLLLRSLL